MQLLSLLGVQLNQTVLIGSEVVPFLPEARGLQSDDLSLLRLRLCLALALRQIISAKSPDIAGGQPRHIADCLIRSTVAVRCVWTPTNEQQAKLGPEGRTEGLLLWCWLRLRPPELRCLLRLAQWQLVPASARAVAPPAPAAAQTSESVMQPSPDCLRTSIFNGARQGRELCQQAVRQRAYLCCHLLLKHLHAKCSLSQAGGQICMLARLALSELCSSGLQVIRHTQAKTCH